MSQENVEIVRHAFDAFGRGDIERLLRVCDEKIVITQPAELLDAPFTKMYGHTGVLEALAIWPEQWDDYRVETLEILADPGDHVVVATRQSGRGRQSGVKVEMDFTFVFTMRDEKINEWRLFLHEAEALEAAGLSG